MKLQHKTQSLHWYSAKDGSPAHDATLREARKDNLLPSVTSIIKNWYNPMLERYKINEALKAAVTLPRIAGEDDEAFGQRCLEESLRHAIEAASAGTALHGELEAWNKSWEGWDAKATGFPLPQAFPAFSPQYEQFCLPYADYATKNYSRIVRSEITLFSANMGIAGRTDLIAMDKRLGMVIADYKTTKVKSYKGKKDPGFWPSYCWQLAVYAELYRLQNDLPEPPRIVSLVVDLDQPGIYEKVWEVEEQTRALEFMKHLIAAWQIEKKYKPMKEYS